MIVSSILDPTPLRYNYGTRHPELMQNTSEIIEIGIQGTTQFYDYPPWAETLGWFMSGISVLMIPVVAAVVIVRRGCHFQMRKIISIGPMDFWPLSAKWFFFGDSTNPEIATATKSMKSQDNEKELEEQACATTMNVNSNSVGKFLAEHPTVLLNEGHREDSTQRPSSISVTLF
ncbi:Transporter [Fasciola gigantica]|uniref:Transporter n=1 Tax=Fasciola gigantica TaxID=46835 RepID=A0A504YWX5_FASGI|nr:Transporter [Fasciola gigantica]